MLEMEASVNAVASSSKLPKTKSKHKSDKHKGHKRDKGAAVNGAVLKKSKTERGGPFEHRRMRMRLSLPPRFSGDYMIGVREQLDAMVMR
jgi:DNA-directed RNA polymerase I subunit RPA43